MAAENKLTDLHPESLVEDAIDLSEYVGMLIENRFLIGGITLAFFIIAIFYALLATPIYKADALIQIEEQQSKLGGVDELAAMMGSDAASSVTEIEILKSRHVVGGVVRKLGLDIKVAPLRFPLIGGFISRGRHTSPVEPWMGFDSYAWGGEQIALDRLEVSRDYVGRELVLQAGEAGRFTLFDDEGVELLQGESGKAVTDESGEVTLFVSMLVARPQTRFMVKKLSTQSVVSDLQTNIRISEKGKKTGILTISLEGADRDYIREVVLALTQSYLRQNVERKSEESERMLSFIQEQLPTLQTDLNAAEQAMNLHRESKGTIDLSYESQNLIKRITDLESQISAVKIERAELTQKLTVSHPLVQALDEKMRNLRGQLKQLEQLVHGLPETELESVKLNRDVTVASELYMLLLNKSQELKVAKAGTVGNVRILDQAEVGERPVKPKKSLIVMVSLLLGFIVGVMIAVARKALNKTVDDPMVVERQLGYPIYAEIPFSEHQEEMIRQGKKKLNKDHFDLLAHAHSDDQVIESMRSLRTSMQFALMEAENRIISISGPSPGIGKSFVSANFAYILADSNKKVLLVDADMRKGHLNYYFKAERSPGLSEHLSGEFELDKVIHTKCLHENLDVITSGVYPPNPSELLMSDAFQRFLSSVKERYDLVIIDTPPILAVTDAAIIGQYVGTNFMVLRAGQHHIREIQTAFRRFEQNGVTIKGSIFNGIQIMKAGYRYGYKYYGYQYDYK